MRRARHLAFAIAFYAGPLCLFAAGAAAPAERLSFDEPTTRQAAPDAAALREAGRLVDDVYRAALSAARTNDDRAALAAKWLKAGIETRNNAAGQYVLLTRARELAADAGDVQNAVAAVAAIGERFDIDAMALDAETVGRLARSVRAPAAQWALASYANGAVSEAAAAERFDLARRLAEAASSAAARADDPQLARLSASRARDVRELESASRAAPRLEAALLQDPDNARAKLDLGRVRALIQGNWDKGLPLLSGAGDASLKTIAKQELDRPSSPQAQAALADAWWDAADRAQGLSKTRMLLRARAWYEQAAPSLAGLNKAKAESRLKETELLASVYGPKSAAASVKPVESDVTELPQGRFRREWTSPDYWANKPEDVVVKGKRITITNDAGANVVVTDAELVREKDGSLTISWRVNPMQLGYEVWSGAGRNITISRWDSKSDKDAGRPAKRTGRIIWK